MSTQSAIDWLDSEKLEKCTLRALCGLGGILEHASAVTTRGFHGGSQEGGWWDPGRGVQVGSGQE
jgi:hypothetical protein